MDKIEGYKLDSVGTYLRADGWCFPMTTDGGYDDDEGGAIHIRDCDPEDEGHEWWQTLSDDDRKIVTRYLEVDNELSKIKQKAEVSK